jgi:hypothetical protein
MTSALSALEIAVQQFREVISLLHAAELLAEHGAEDEDLIHVLAVVTDKAQAAQAAAQDAVRAAAPAPTLQEA